MSDLTRLNVDTPGSYSFIVPFGVSSNVEVHLWGGGGGDGSGAKGGGGGYVRSNITVQTNDVVSIVVGGKGRAYQDSGTGGFGGSGGGGEFNGGSGGNQGISAGGAAGGGGGATAILINGTVVSVAAGAGGGGGGRDVSVGGATQGRPGGESIGPLEYPALVVLDPRTGSSDNGFYIRDAGDRTNPSNIIGARQYIVRLRGVTVWDSRSPPPNNYQPGTYRGGIYGISDTGTITREPFNQPRGDVLSAFDLIVGGVDNWSANSNGQNGPLGGSGGGGGGYPLGGATGIVYGDSQPGGGGGQNYGNITVPGSGQISGGADLRSVFSIPSSIGDAGYDGYAILFLTRDLQFNVKDSGTYKPITNAYIKFPPSTRTITRIIPPTSDTYNSTGTQTFTIPAGVTTVDLTVVGAGGGGGGNDSSPGAAGRPGARIAGTLAVSPGQVLTIAVGAGGGGGASDQGSAAGGRAGVNTLGYGGGLGGASGPVPISGAGGGGGAASVILLNGSPVVVAAGGGGGGGGGNGVPGQGVSPGGSSGSTAGGAGTNKSGDGGGGGGGGGGYPSGGAGGSVNGGDVGGNSGADGQNLVPGGFVLSQGAAGGVESIRGSRAAGNGGSGRITVSYSTPPITEVVAAGGWTKISEAYIKVSGSWKKIIAGTISLTKIS
jgi:hypothetical protein